MGIAVDFQQDARCGSTAEKTVDFTSSTCDFAGPGEARIGDRPQLSMKADFDPAYTEV